ncbi:MAG TPA: AMP-binding protein, partial [Aggregatilineales bacterium]|nr:AMP-binding protein [Aggregatilineales bacterium]
MQDAQSSANLNVCIHHLIEQRAANAPEAIALEYAGEQVSYGELNTRANQMAHRLRELGVKRDALIGIYMQRSLEMVMSLVAIYKSGGAYVPLDPAYPEDRLSYMLSDSGAQIVLTQSALMDRLPETDARVLAVDVEDFSAYPADNLPDGEPDQLAYVIYTSGSTGKPKGVLLEHCSVVNYILAARERFGTQASDRVLLFSSINFDASVEEMLTALTGGGTLVIRTDDMVTSVPTFLQKVEEWGITALSIPTAFWHEVVNEMKGLPPQLRYVVIGGEKASAVRLARWQQFTNIPLWNAYGPTETTIGVTL